MSSVCCVNCFNDNAIKRVIISLSQLGRCHYCNQNNAPIISIDNLLTNLTSTLEGFSIMFEEDDHATRLIDILDEDFKIFSKTTEKSRLKNNLSLISPNIFNKKFKSANIVKSL